MVKFLFICMLGSILIPFRSEGMDTNANGALDSIAETSNHEASSNNSSIDNQSKNKSAILEVMCKDIEKLATNGTIIGGVSGIVGASGIVAGWAGLGWPISGIPPSLSREDLETKCKQYQQGLMKEETQDN